MKQHRSTGYENSRQSARNDLLHPKNPYYQRPFDFFDIYWQNKDEIGPYISIKDHFKKKAYFDWKSAAANRALTKVLLKKDFGITLPRPIPDSFLCPPLPNRLNYLCWLDDLTQSTLSLTEDILDSFGVTRPVVIDIGTGLLGIYAILGAVVFKMRFFASDISPESIEFLKEILASNDQIAGDIKPVCVPDSSILQEQIKKSLSDPAANPLDTSTIAAVASNPSSWGPIRQLFNNSNDDRLRYRLLDANYQYSNQYDNHDREDSNMAKKKKRSGSKECNIEEVNESVPQSSNTPQRFNTIISAVMTNPPFYDIEEEVNENEETVCTGNITEMKTMGGEVAFITGMIIDSLVLRESILWYSAMVGKKSSLKVLRNILSFYGIPKSQIFETSFEQGVTYRWAIAWTFSIEAAALYHSFAMLNVTKASDEVCFTNAKSTSTPAIAVDHIHQANIVLSVNQVVETMLQSEKVAPYPTGFDSLVNNQDNLVAIRCFQRLILCVDQLATNLSQQNFQGFEEVKYMTPLGHFNNLKWNIHVSYEIIPSEAIGSNTSTSPLCGLRCRLSHVSTVGAASSSNSLDFQTPEVLKPLLDLQFSIIVQSVERVVVMDADDVSADESPISNESKLQIVMEIVRSYCSAGLANKLFQRSLDFFGAELSRSNRRWRRALQRELEDKGQN